MLFIISNEIRECMQVQQARTDNSKLCGWLFTCTYDGMVKELAVTESNSLRGMRSKLGLVVSYLLALKSILRSCCVFADAYAIPSHVCNAR